ncbi:peptide chain release factor N(5)-glutamine methyltransferase [uncultured Streptococcus sp.]|uniref:peptide chain release factor N(5)-glutamine methyltransferase n=1 Tax=uncultured Streptococcus sp. TaxID=83427 RepID=UPI002666ECBA|nr:peptide chain release factor N(5)-glutamine methyltransferase [uncultured Streptococcus sp.]
MILADALAGYEKQLDAVGEEQEALSFVYRGLKHWDLTQFVLHLRQEVSEEDEKLLSNIFHQLKVHKPAQYILGFEDFHGLRFQVDERVLIPRPETQELVELILAENPKTELKVLDIGTGSGAIAVSLKESCPLWQLTASDLSVDAIELARENAKLNQVDISFIQSDVFENISGSFDIIVSNPPYISENDKNEVGLNVLASEPKMALFADEDGLAIYRQIIERAAKHLSPQGKLYFEIGYKQGSDLKKLLSLHFPDKSVRVLKDQFGQDRMVVIDDGN